MRIAPINNTTFGKLNVSKIDKTIENIHKLCPDIESQRAIEDSFDRIDRESDKYGEYILSVKRAPIFKKHDNAGLISRMIKPRYEVRINEGSQWWENVRAYIAVNDPADVKREKLSALADLCNEQAQRDLR